MKTRNLISISLAFSILFVQGRVVLASDFQSSDGWEEDNASITVPMQRPSSARIEEEVEDDEFIEAASHLSLYQKIMLLELNLIGHANTDDNHAKRLEHLEEEVVDIPLREQVPSVSQQIASLLQIAPPSDELVRFMVEDSNSKRINLESERQLPFVASIYQQLNWIERAVFGKQFRGTKIKRRILKLELEVLKTSKENRSDLSISERVHNLMVAVNPPEELLAEDFAKPETKSLRTQTYSRADKPNFARSGIRKFLTGTSSARRSIGDLLSSPTFWTIVAGGAALFGAYMLSRNGGGNRNYIESERMCMGHWNCHRCTNCLYCQHCKTSLQPCGILLRTRGIAP